MANKPATIVDLFSPMKSIESCMDAHGKAIANNLSMVNESILNCASSLSAGNLILKNATNKIEKTIKNSLKELNEISQKQTVSGATASAGIASAVTASIGVGFDNMSIVFGNISSQITYAIKVLEKIEKHTNGKRVLSDNIKDTFRKKEKKYSINAPDVSGGKGAGELAKALADAARTINGISFKDSFLLKKKSKNIIGGLLDVLQEYDKEMKPSSMKKKRESMESLEKIAISMNDISKNLAVSAVYSVPAIVGAKLSKKVIENLISAIEPLGDPKQLKKNEQSAESLANISKSILLFDAAMALSSILAIPAMIGITLNALAIREALWVFKPLSEKNKTLEIAKSAHNLQKMSESILLFDAAMALSSILAIPAMIGIGLNALVIGSANAIFSLLGNKITTHNVKSAAWTMELMCLSMISFSLALLASSMILKYLLMGKDNEIDVNSIASIGASFITFKLMLGAYTLYSELGIGGEPARIGALTTLFIGLSLITFSAAMFVSYMITKKIISKGMEDGKFGADDIVSLVSIVPVFLLMYGAYRLYSELGSPKSSKEALAGGISVIMMSVGLIAFALSFYVVHQITKSIVGKWEPGKDPSALMMDIAIFGLMAGSMFLFKTIGKNTKDIFKGVAVSIAISVSIAVFGFALKMYTDATRGTKPGELLMLPALIGLLGIEMGIIGVAAIPIAIGAATTIAMAGAVTLFGVGLEKIIGPIKSIDRESYKTFTGIIADTGLTMAMLGNPLVAPFITLGATAMLVASGAVKKLSEGLKTWSETDIDSEKINLLCNTIVDIKGALQGTKPGEEKPGFLKKLGNAIGGTISAPFDLVQMKTSAKALSVAGEAIQNISKGMKIWSASNITETDVENCLRTITTIQSVFAEIGSSKSGKKSLLQSLIGIDFTGAQKTDVEVGAKSVRKMGKALTEISEGLVKWNDGIGSKFKDPKYLESFSTSVGNVVAGLSSVFAAVASDDNTIENKARETKTFIGALVQDLTQNVWSKSTKNRVAEGIKSVKDLGDTIKDIALGLKEFKELVPSGNNSWITGVAAGISALLTGLQEPLIAFGTTDETFTKSLGSASSKAKSYGDALSMIHDISSQTISYEHHKTDVAKAMENVGQIGNLVKGLAEGVKIMADKKLTKDLGTAGILKDGSFEFETEGTGMIGNVQKLVCSQLGIFIELGKKVEELGIYEAFHDEIVQDVRRGGKRTTNKTLRVSEGNKSYLTMAITAAASIGDVIKGLANSYAEMDKAFPTDKKMINGTARVTKSISGVMTAFSVLGQAVSGTISGDKIELVPSSMGMPEMTKEFGYVSGNLSSLRTNALDIASNRIKTVLSNMPIDKLKPNSGKNFVSFASNMTKGMNMLAGAQTNIQHSTKFIETLNKAVDKKVFDNISNNTNSIASSINSINNDTFEPYAKMIAALGEMTTKHSDFVNMQKELFELLKKIIEEINNVDNTSNNTSVKSNNIGSNNNYTNNSNKKPSNSIATNKSNAQPQTVVAKLSQTSVSVDGAEFLRKLETMLNQYLK